MDSPSGPFHSSAGLLARLAGGAALFALTLLIFSPLLLSPDRFPAGGSPEEASRAIADALVRARGESEWGEIGYLDPGGRNRAGDRASFYTHPVYYGLSRFLPHGLSLTLVALLYTLFLGLGAHAFTLLLGFRPGPALFAGAVAISSGGAVAGLASPGDLGVASAAAMTPALALLAHSLWAQPSAFQIAALGVLVALAAAGGDPAAFLAAMALAAFGVVLLERRRDRNQRPGPISAVPRFPRAQSALHVALALFIGLGLVSYRTLPLILEDPGSLPGLFKGPWWLGAALPLRLPFFLGATAVVSIAGALVGPCRDRRTVSFVVAALAATFLSPAAFLPFVGLPLALAAAAGAARLGEVTPAWLPVASILCGTVAIEAVPHQSERLIGRRPEEAEPALVVPAQLGAASFPRGLVQDPAGEAFGAVGTVERLPNGFRLQATVPGDAFLVFTEPFLPGMAARVDGRAAPISKANGGQIGLSLSGGSHQVWIRFHPPGLAAGMAISTLSVAALFFVLAAPLLSALRSRIGRGRARAQVRPALVPSVARRAVASAARR